MVNLRAEYCKEREGIETHEAVDQGFIEYKIGERYNKYVCFIKNLFVRKELRRTGVGIKMTRHVEQLAKDAGCSHMLCCVEMNQFVFGQPTSLNAIYSDGYQAVEYDSSQTLWLIKEL